MMAGHENFSDDDWTPEERALLGSLPRERVPSPHLRARTIESLRQLGAESRSNRSPGRAVALIAAAAGIFVAGTLVGFAVARHGVITNSPSRATTARAVVAAEQPAPSEHQVRYVLWY